MKILIFLILFFASPAFAVNTCDFDIATGQSEVNYQADINAHLDCVVTNNSGATAPATTEPYQFWVDTTSNKLMMRNGSNSKWVDLGDVTAVNLGHAISVLTTKGDIADNRTVRGGLFADDDSDTGNVVGPASATDNSLTRFDSTTGKLIQNSTVIVDDSGSISGVNNITLGGVIAYQDQTGLDDIYNQFRGFVSANPIGGPSYAVNVGVRGEVVLQNINDVDISNSHQVGVLCYSRNFNAGTDGNSANPYMIGCEGKLENEVPKKVNFGIGVESQISKNVTGGIFESFTGFNAGITASEGDVFAMSGLTVGVNGFNGNMSLGTGLTLGDFDEDAPGGAVGDIATIFGMHFVNQTKNEANIFGLFMENQTGTHLVQDFLHNQCLTCRSLLGTDLVQQGATSGTVTIHPPPVAGTRDIEWPADSGVVALTKDPRLVQVINSQVATTNSGTNRIPFDDTVPQNYEGNEFITVTVTPEDTTNKLIIRWEISVGVSHVSGAYTACALFQDDLVSALDTKGKFVFAGITDIIAGEYQMTAGQDAPITFKVHCGAAVAGTTYLNRNASGRAFGGTMHSSITVFDYQP